MKKQLLIIDDEPDFLAALGLKAKSRGFEYTFAPNGVACLKTLNTLRPDAILLDLNLPDISGLGLMQELRRRDALSHIPIIILSGVHDYEVIEEAMGRGATAYFVKGGELDELFGTLERHLALTSLAAPQAAPELGQAPRLVASRTPEVQDPWLNNAAHTLRTPLVVVQMALSSLAEGLAGPLNEEQKAFVDLGRKNARKLEQLVAELLAHYDQKVSK